MSKSLAIRGALLVSDGACGCSSSDQTTKPMALGGTSGVCCDSGLSYEDVITGSPSIATAGAIGQNFVDLPGLDGFTSIEFLRLVSSARIRLRVNPTRPQLLGSAVLPVTGVQAGAATFTVTDTAGTTYVATVNFTAAENTPAKVVNAINAALAAVGAPVTTDGPIARLSGTTLLVVNPGIGPLASLELAAGAPVDLGLGVVLVTVVGTASDLPDTEGLVILQFPRWPNAPTKIQVSGVAVLDIVAAGRTSA